ncbi:MAG: hypothetical protein V4596_06300 [Bdellovibrionota bacterium]
MKINNFVLFFLIIFSVVAKADDPKSLDAAMRSRWIQIEYLLKNPRLQLEKRKDLTRELAEEYISDQRWQEAIWILRENGNTEQAEILERRLAEKMTQGQIEVIHKFEGSKEAARIVRIQGTNIYGIIKLNSSYFGFEIAAYKLDRILKLNLVPFTIERILPDGRRGSIQYFIRDAVEARESLGVVGFPSKEQKKQTEFRYYGYPTSQKNMWLLDYLIVNLDRHGRNWLWHLGEQHLRPVAIDHGISFGRGASEKGVNFEYENLPDSEMVQNLKQLSLEKLRNEFTNLIGADNVTKLFKRKIQVVRAANSMSPFSCQSLFL